MREPQGPTVDLTPAAAARERFVQAWNAALTSGLQPQIEPFLTGLDETEREMLRAELLRLDADFRGRLQATRTTAQAETLDGQTPVAGTLDYHPG
jgi:hypothetical protein